MASNSPTPSADGSFEAPSRSSRAKCWAARDAYFTCLDRANILDAIKDADAAGKACGKEDQKLGKECAASWVSLRSCPFTRLFGPGSVASYDDGGGWQRILGASGGCCLARGW